MSVSGAGIDGQLTPFATAQALLQPDIDRFGEGELDRHSVLAAADPIAEQCKVRSSDLRGWAKAQMDTLQARPASTQAAPVPLCAVDPEPSGNPAPTGNALEAIATMVRARIYGAPEIADTVALFCTGTWGVYPPSDPSAGPDIFPRLHIRSPAKRCGKSTLLEIVQHMVRRPLAATDVTEAAIFRSMAKWQPTLVIDEADRLLAKNRDLTGIVNSGYSRTGHVVRTMEVQVQGVRSFEPTTFSTFGPIALAGIGVLPSTIEDRALRIEMQRQPRDRKSQRIGLRQLAELREKIAPHLMAHADAIGAAMAQGVPDTAIPSTLNDRDADNWRPLLGLAALAGGDWLTRAQRAAATLCGLSADSDRGNEWVLRQIIEYIIDERSAAVTAYLKWRSAGRQLAKPIGVHSTGVQRVDVCRFINSDQLASWLLMKDDSGFADARDTGSIKLRVARVLRGFGITPIQRRVNGQPTRGYDVAAIRAVWRRYQP